MLDRASTFAHPEIVKLLQTEFVPVAIDQAYQRRQQDSEGDFYRKIAGQGPRNNFQGTTQGFYVATPAGELLLYNNNRDPEKVFRLIKKSLTEFKSQHSSVLVEQIERETTDKRYNPKPPEGGLVVRVHAKILDGYEPTDDQWRSIFQNAMSRDNLWVTAAEHRALIKGEFPASLQQRIARFHLVDNTRGEPPMWRPNEIRDLQINTGRGDIAGQVLLNTDGDERGYDASLKGRIEVHDDKVTRFDMVCLGSFWGEGRYTRGAPEGRFKLAISFTLADGTDIADAIPPQGSRGWLDGYLRTDL